MAQLRAGNNTIERSQKPILWRPCLQFWKWESPPEDTLLLLEEASQLWQSRAVTSLRTYEKMHDDTFVSRVADLVREMLNIGNKPVTVEQHSQETVEAIVRGSFLNHGLLLFRDLVNQSKRHDAVIEKLISSIISSVETSTTEDDPTTPSQCRRWTMLWQLHVIVSNSPLNISLITSKTLHHLLVYAAYDWETSNSSRKGCLSLIRFVLDRLVT